MVERFPRNKTTKLYTVSSRASRGPRRIGNDPLGWDSLTRDPARGVAKSVCHSERRSLPNRQLRRLCRTEFGSPIRGSPGVASVTTCCANQAQWFRYMQFPVWLYNLPARF